MGLGLLRHLSFELVSQQVVEGSKVDDGPK